MKRSATQRAPVPLGRRVRVRSSAPLFSLSLSLSRSLSLARLLSPLRRRRRLPRMLCRAAAAVPVCAVVPPAPPSPPLVRSPDPLCLAAGALCPTAKAFDPHPPELTLVFFSFRFMGGAPAQAARRVFPFCFGQERERARRRNPVDHPVIITITSARHGADAHTTYDEPPNVPSSSSGSTHTTQHRRRTTKRDGDSFCFHRHGNRRRPERDQEKEKRTPDALAHTRTRAEGGRERARPPSRFSSGCVNELFVFSRAFFFLRLARALAAL